MGNKKFVFLLVSVIIFITSLAAKHQGEYRYQDCRCEPELQHIRRLFGLLLNESSIRSNHSGSPSETSSNHQESSSKAMIPLKKNSLAHPSLPASNQHVDLLLGIRKMGYKRENLAKLINESSIRLNHLGSPSKTSSNHSGSPSKTSEPKTMMALKNSSAHPSLPASNHPGSCPATHNVTATGLEKRLAGFADTVREYIVIVSLMMILLSLIDSII